MSGLLYLLSYQRKKKKKTYPATPSGTTTLLRLNTHHKIKYLYQLNLEKIFNTNILKD